MLVYIVGTYCGSDVTGHIYIYIYIYIYILYVYIERKNGLWWHVRRFRFVPSACYATAAMGICTRKNEKNKMAVSFVWCVWTRTISTTTKERVYDIQTDRQTDRQTYPQPIKTCRSWETNSLQIGLPLCLSVTCPHHLK